MIHLLASQPPIHGAAGLGALGLVSFIAAVWALWADGRDDGSKKGKGKRK